MNRLATLALLAVTVAYPFLVAASVGRLHASHAAFVLLAVAFVRACLSGGRVWWAACAGTACLTLATTLADDWLALKLYPVLVNAVMLLVFASSLRHGKTAIERIARLTEPDLPPAGVRYTRRLTQVWCGFFALNGLVSLWTAIDRSDQVWALYNGCIAYVLIGALLVGERLLRGTLRRRMERGAAHGAHA
jgi:uncharacterized membrane protein